MLPIYNEVRAIADAIERLEQTCSALSLRYEIVCVDDGSRDGTVLFLCDGTFDCAAASF